MIHAVRLSRGRADLLKKYEIDSLFPCVLFLIVALVHRQHDLAEAVGGHQGASLAPMELGNKGR